MPAFDNLWNKEDLIRKTIEIDSDVYEKLQYLSENKYDMSANKLINVAILYLIEHENILKNDNYLSKKGLFEKHTLLIRKSICVGLDNLKDKYNIPIYKLVDIALKNAINNIDKKG